jgi:phage gp16-like protein
MATVSHERSASRDRLIRLIHVAKRDLALDDETYRGALHAVIGKTSTTAMSVPELQKVMDHLKSKGFKVRPSAKSRPLARYPEARKIRAIWLLLHKLGAVENPSEAALAAYVKRITGIDALQWIGGDQAERVIETLKKWAMRFLPDAVRALADRLSASEVPMPRIDITELSWKLSDAFERMTFDPMLLAWQSLNEILENA